MNHSDCRSGAQPCAELSPAAIDRLTAPAGANALRVDVRALCRDYEVRRIRTENDGYGSLPCDAADRAAALEMALLRGPQTRREEER